ncbi:MAG: hypothetical protein ACP5I1_10240 [Candidatus Hinthialibacter sp.]
MNISLPKIIWLAAYACLLPMAGFAVDLGEEEVEVTLEHTYTTKYIWMGYDIFSDDAGAFQPSLTVDWREFYMGVMGSLADESGYQDEEELQYFLGYNRRFFEDDVYALNTVVGYTYYDRYKSDSVSGKDGVSDTSEIWVGMYFPQLIPLGDSYLVPSTSFFYEYDGIQHEDDVDNGWLFKFDLSYDLPIPALISDQDKQTLNFNCNVMYNDGIFGSDSAWSHSGLGIETTFEWRGLYFTPSLHYQFSFDDTINPEDEFFSAFTIGYSF